MLSDKQYEIMASMLGMSAKVIIPKTYYRNRYVTKKGSDGLVTINQLHDLNYVVSDHQLGGNIIWSATTTGKKAFVGAFNKRHGLVPESIPNQETTDTTHLANVMLVFKDNTFFQGIVSAYCREVYHISQNVQGNTYVYAWITGSNLFTLAKFHQETVTCIDAN